MVATAIGLVSLVLAVIGLVAAARWRPRKELLFQHSDERVVFLDEAVRKQITAHFENSRIEGSVHRVRVSFCNGGTREIRVDDWERPLLVDFGEGSRVLESTVVNKVPELLAIEQRQDMGKLSIECGSLNPKDWFAVSVLVGEFAEELKVDGRMLGGEITYFPSGDVPMAIVFLLWFASIITGFVAALVFDWRQGVLVAVFVAMLGVVLRRIPFKELTRLALGLPVLD